MTGFNPEGEPVSSKVSYRNPSVSWVRNKLWEDACLLCRTHGFRHVPAGVVGAVAVFGFGVGVAVEADGVDTIALLHPELDCLSFLFKVIETEEKVD